MNRLAYEKKQDSRHTILPRVCDKIAVDRRNDVKWDEEGNELLPIECGGTVSYTVWGGRGEWRCSNCGHAQDSKFGRDK